MSYGQRLPTSSRRSLQHLLVQEIRPSPGIDVFGHGLIPDRHVWDLDNQRWVPYHIAQDMAWESKARIIALIAGSQGGKTSFGPLWIHREIYTRGGGDYIAATSTLKLFKSKMMPALMAFLVEKLNVARYWGGDNNFFEFRDPLTGKFRAKRSTDLMWARLHLMAAEQGSGLEAMTAKAAWLDECGQDRFKHDAYKAIRRRLAIARGRILMSTTLYDYGYIDTEIIARAEKGGTKQIIEVETGGEIERTTNEKAALDVIQYDSIVNPVYPREEYDEARETSSGDEFAAFWRGRRTQSVLMIYDCWDKDKNTCPRFPIDPSWPRWMGLDFGPVNTVALYLAQDPRTPEDQPTFYLHRIYKAGGKTGADHAKDILDGEPGIPKSHGGSGSESNWRLEFGKGGLPIREPNFKTDVGLQITTTYAGIKRRQLVVFDDLTEFLDRIPLYKWKRDKHGNKLSVVQDERQFHYMAALRYVGSKIFKPPPKVEVTPMGG